jgi:hypothetical protein
MAGPWSLQRRCPDCGRTATIKVAALTADCDGDTMRGAARGHPGVAETAAAGVPCDRAGPVELIKREMASFHSCHKRRG